MSTHPKRTVRLLAGIALIFLLVLPARAQDWRPVRALGAAGAAEPVRVRVDRADPDLLELTYAMPKPGFSKTGRRAVGGEQEQVVLGNVPRTGGIGQPLLPVVPARVLLPAGRELVELQVVPGRKVALAGRHVIEHACRQFPLVPGVWPEPTEPDRAVYGSDQPFPGRLNDPPSVQRKRGAAVVLVNLHPVELQPLSGQASYYETMTVRVVTRPSVLRPAAKYRPDAGRPLSGWVDNPDAAASYEQAASAPVKLASLCNPADSYAYVVVTSAEFRDASDPYAVTNLLAHKRARGLTAALVTMGDITANYSGTDNAEKLRNFILDAYNNWETDYVLLAGDTGVVPLRKLWCEASSGGLADQIPSDLYYQCLDGNYNSDGDGNWGEPTDGSGGSDVDLLAEVYIGRASAENTNEMANFVYKTIAYETEDEGAAYLRTALIAGEYLGSQFGPGDFAYATPYMEEIRNGADTSGYTTEGFAANPLVTVHTLYDQEGYSWPKSEMLGRINSGAYSIINHLGHAGFDYVMRFYNGDADALTNNTFLFAYSQGCIPGNFEADCIGEHLTTSTRHGMFAVVFNSRYGWGAYNTSSNTLDGGSQRFDRQFWDACFGEEIMSLGAINADSHEDNLWDINGSYIRWCFYESNLLGDPQTPLRGLSVADMILLTPGSGLAARGAQGGPFAPASVTYYLLSTATNLSLNWAASCTQAWVTLSTTNGTLGPGESASFSLQINTNAESLAEGEYFDTLVFTNLTTGKGSTTRDIHLFVNNPPRVTNSSVQAGDRLPAGGLTYTVRFSEPMNQATATSNAFSLVGDLSGPHGVLPYWNANTTTLTFAWQSLPDDRYTLTLRSGGSQFEDPSGMALDGETPSWPIPPNRSGDGVEGGDFTFGFELDGGTNRYPTPLATKPPDGSLVYDPSVAGFISPAGDADRYTLGVDSGQVLTVVAEADSNLQVVVRLYDPVLACVGSATGSAAGAAAILQAVPFATGGTYAVELAGLGVSTGRYALRVVLNAVVEGEGYGGPSNDTRAAAQSLDGTFIGLPAGVSRAAVLGSAERGPMSAIFEEDFEGGLGAFTVDNDVFGGGGGLWHLSSGRGADAGHSPTSSAYYGHNEGPSGGGDYETGAANAGALITPSIGLPDVEDITLEFRFFLETEGSLRWDLCTVEADTGSGYMSFLSSEDGSLPTGSGGAWTNLSADLSAFQGQDVVFRFGFDTIDSLFNDFEGWYLDDVRVVTYEEGAPDFYAFTLAEGETVALMLTALSGSGLALELQDSGGTVLARGTNGAANVSAAIRSWTAPGAGTYYARVTARGAAYSLVVIRGAGFSLEPNDTPAGAQPVAPPATVLGTCRAAPIAAEAEPNDDGVTGYSTNDFPHANDWSGSFFEGGTNHAFRASLSGAIAAGSDGDGDFFRLYAAPGDLLEAALAGQTLTAPCLRLYSRTGTLLALNNGSSETAARVAYSGFSYAGEYYVAADSVGSAIGAYVLTATLTTTNLRRSADEDVFSFEADAGDEVTVRTWTPGDEPLEFVNTLDPAVDLVDPDGGLQASDDDGAPDGRNALLTNRVLWAGTWAARVRAAAGDGEYLVQISRQAGPPVVSFAAALSQGSETSAIVSLPVTLSAPTSQTVTVQYGVTGGTASNGADFTLAPGTLVLLPGQTATSITFTVANDGEDEGTETLTVTLSDPTNAILGRYAAHTRVILDDESPLLVQFTSPVFATPEEGSGAVIRVERSGGNDGIVTVDYATSDGTAEAGSDYTAATGTLVLADGVATGSFLVPVVFDMYVEGDETVNLDLSAPTGGAGLGSPAHAVLTVIDYAFPRTNLLVNPGFELATDRWDFVGSSWDAWGDVARADWAAHSGRAGAYFEGWVEDGWGWVLQDVAVMRGTYTFTVWVRREAGFDPWYLELALQWYDAEWNEIQDDTFVECTEMPGDAAWHHLHVTGTCLSNNLAWVEPQLYAYWWGPAGSPSAFMFDDASLYAGAYTGVSTLANTSFGEGKTNGDTWRGSSWYALPENVANARESWAGRTNAWGGALYGWDGVSNQLNTRISQALVPGTGTYTFAVWLLRETNFLLVGTALRLEWYDATFTNKVQADSVTNLVVPNDQAWHEYYVIGSCTNPGLYELRATVDSRYLYNTTNLQWRAMKIDDATFLRGYRDQDGDGIPDYWEDDHFGGPTNATAWEDFDHDGFPTLDEYFANTDPKDSNAFLRIVGMTSSAPCRLSFTGSPERVYNVYYTTNLLRGSWSDLGVSLPGEGGLVTVTDSNGGPFRVYRVRVLPP